MSEPDSLIPAAAPGLGPDKKRYLTATLVLLVGAVGFVLWRAWVCDDAFITFRHVANWQAGYGPVFNVGERVQGFTHPLWFLLLAAGSLVIDIYAWAVTLGLVSTAAIVLVLGHYFRDRRHAGMCLLATMGILLSSRTFVEYQTSGLETCLTHLLVVWLWAWLTAVASRDGGSTLSSPPLTKGGQGGVQVRDPASRTPAPAGIVLLCSLLMLTRPDHAVPCALPLLLAAVQLFRQHSRRQWLLSLLAIVPLVGWYGFATVYYGTPLPNTAYAKTGLAIGPVVIFGLGYLRNYAIHEPVHSLVISVVMITQTIVVIRDLVRRRPGGGIRLVLVLAVWLQVAYVVMIGGDFMRGRFLSLRLVASAVLAADLVGRLPATRSWKTAFTLALIAGLVWSFGRAVTQLTGIQLIGPVGVPPIFPVAFLAVAGFGALILTVLLVSRRTLSPGPAAAGLVLTAAGVCTLFDFKPRTSDFAYDGVADEYAWYAGTWRDPRFGPPARYSVELTRSWVDLGMAARRYADQNGPITLAVTNTGFMGCLAGPQVHLVDLHGLSDPFIASLPPKPFSRIGHLVHDVPDAYLQTRGVLGLQPDWRARLDKGDPTLVVAARTMAAQAQWSDSHLQALWAEIETVTRGPIWSAERWRLIPRYAMRRK